MARLPALLFVCSLALLGGAPPGAGAAPAGPELSVPEKKLAASLSCPERFTRPGEPVLLVHGTWANSEVNWGWGFVPGLEAAGLDACLVDLPDYSTGDIQETAEYVVWAVGEIHRRSGEKVDVVGHSQGGLQPRWAIKWWPGVQAAVDDYVMLASPNHGTVWADVPASTTGCMPSCMQMATTSKFIAALNRGDETPGDVSYTSLYSAMDELVQPAAPEPTAALEGAENVLMQEICPGRPVDHLSFAADAAVFDIVLDAFTHPGPFDPARFNLATSCAKTMIEGTNAGPLLQGESGYQFPVGDTVQSAEEPPLKPYARGAAAAGSGSGSKSGGGDGEPHPGPAAAGGSSAGADAVVSGRPTPATGAPTTLLMAAGSGLAGLGWFGLRRGIRPR